ncbi:MAG TPA: hypothetical protein PKE21_05485 [Flavobacteriales bacterium]|nr:hypothetical protein [Flavobacteriales bacterium]HMR26913.1 hypothetical protein [Flavobacteriales bacterium]
MRRAVILLVLLGLTGFGAWQLLRGLRPATPATDPWRLLPEGTCAVLALPDASAAWERWSHGSVLGTALKDQPALNALERMSTALAPVRERLAGSPVLAAWGDGADGTGEVVVIATMTPVARDAWMSALAERTAAGTPVALAGEGMPTGWHMLEHHGLLLFGPDADRLRALAARGARTAASDSLLQEARTTLGAHATAHLLLRTGTVPAWAKAAPWRALFSALPTDGGWLALDLEPRAEGLIAGGVLVPAPSSDGAAAVDPLPALRVLPGQVRWFEQVSLPDDSSVITWHDASIVRARASGPNGPLQWTVLRADDPMDAALAVGDLAAGQAPRREHRGKLMMQVEGLRELAALPGDSAPWCVLHEHWCLLASDSMAARLAVDALVDGHTLGNDLAVAAELAELAAPAQGTWWCDLGAGGPALQRPVGDSLGELRPWSELGTLFVQRMRTTGGKAYLSIALRAGRIRPQATPAMRPEAGGPSTMDQGIAHVQAVRNHVNGTQELLVQDHAGLLSLRTPGGRVLWQVPLDGPLLGPALQVDRYHNGKLQVLALTARTLYLIDRNGRAVDGFPVKLAAAASAPVACYDYDGDGQLRILVPMSDGRVLNLAADGRPVKGWEAAQASTAIASSVHHLRVRGKDHLLYADASGTVHHLDRRGVRRSTPRLKLPEAARPVAVLPATGDAVTVVWITSDGVVQEATLDGTPRAVARIATAIGQAMDGKVRSVWWSTADSLFVRDAGGRVKGVAAPGDVEGARTVRSGDRLWWAVRRKGGPWSLVDERGRAVAEATAEGPAVLTDLEPDGRPDLVVLPASGAPEVVRPASTER